MAETQVPKDRLKAAVAIILLLFTLGVPAYTIYTGQVTITGQLDIGVIQGFIIAMGTAAIIRWLFGEGT